VTTQLDVTSDVDRVVDRTVEEQGHLDCPVNNAGFGRMGSIEDVPVDEVAEQYDVNVFGPHRLTRAVLPQMRDRNSGTIVNVTTVTDAFAALGETPTQRERRVTDGLLAERAQLDAGTMDENLRNRYCLTAAILTERVEITSYEGLLRTAEAADLRSEVTEPLENTLREDEKPLRKLRGLTEGPERGLRDRLSDF